MDLLIGELVEPRIIAITAVHHQHRAGLETQRSRHVDLVLFAFGDDGEARQIAIVIQNQMQLHRAFGLPKHSPIEHAGAEIDDRGVDAHELVLETKLLLCVSAQLPLALGEQLMEHGFIQLPRPMFIGVGQRRPRRRLRQSQVPQLTFAARQAAANLPQRLRPAQLAIHHRHELPPTSEPASVTFGLMLPHRLVKLPAREQTQQLTENAAYSIQAAVSLAQRSFSRDKPSP